MTMNDDRVTLDVDEVLDSLELSVDGLCQLAGMLPGVYIEVYHRLSEAVDAIGRARVVAQASGGTSIVEGSAVILDESTIAVTVRAPNPWRRDRGGPPTQPQRITKL